MSVINKAKDFFVVLDQTKLVDRNVDSITGLHNIDEEARIAVYMSVDSNNQDTGLRNKASAVAEKHIGSIILAGQVQLRAYCPPAKPIIDLKGTTGFIPS